MTEAEWLACEDSLPMLRHLGKKANGRKLRLFAVACCRPLLHLLTDERNRLAVEVAERYADEQSKRIELRQAEKDSRQAAHVIYGLLGDNYAALAASDAAAYSASTAAYEASYYAQTVRKGELALPGGSWVEASSPHARLVRDIFGPLPFRPVSINQSWLAWNDSAVVRLAQAAYKERELPSGHLDTTRLAILADALEEAGCSDAEVLTHLRGPGHHVRGCWVLDLLLERE
jgi:hypothetical protein